MTGTTMVIKVSYGYTFWMASAVILLITCELCGSGTTGVAHSQIASYQPNKNQQDLRDTLVQNGTTIRWSNLGTGAENPEEPGTKSSWSIQRLAVRHGASSFRTQVSDPANIGLRPSTTLKDSTWAEVVSAANTFPLNWIQLSHALDKAVAVAEAGLTVQAQVEYNLSNIERQMQGLLSSTEVRTRTTTISRSRRWKFTFHRVKKDYSVDHKQQHLALAFSRPNAIVAITVTVLPVAENSSSASRKKTPAPTATAGHSVWSHFSRRRVKRRHRLRLLQLHAPSKKEPKSWEN